MTTSLAARKQAGAFAMTVTTVLSAFMLLAGVWALLAPASFAGAVNYPLSEHFVHDAGAFQLGIGATLAFALFWRDGYVVALAGFLVGNTIHMINHAVDLHLGGHAWDPWVLGFVSLLTAAALAARVRQTARAARSGDDA